MYDVQIQMTIGDSKCVKFAQKCAKFAQNTPTLPNIRQLCAKYVNFAKNAPNFPKKRLDSFNIMVQ